MYKEARSRVRAPNCSTCCRIIEKWLWFFDLEEDEKDRILYAFVGNAEGFMIPSMGFEGKENPEHAARYVPDVTRSDQGFLNDYFRQNWCRLDCKG